MNKKQEIKCEEWRKKEQSAGVKKMEKTNEITRGKPLEKRIEQKMKYK